MKWRDLPILTVAAFVMVFAAIFDWPLTAWARRKTDGGQQK